MICKNKHREGFICTRERRHSGDHLAHDTDGEIVKRWRGGRTDWSHYRDAHAV